MGPDPTAIIPAGTTVSLTKQWSAQPGCHGLLVYIKGSAGGGSVDVVVSYLSPSGYASGTILDSGSVSGTTAKVLRISPDLTASANAIAQDVVGATVQIAATVTGTFTYGVDIEPTY